MSSHVVRDVVPEESENQSCCSLVRVAVSHIAFSVWVRWVTVENFIERMLMYFAALCSFQAGKKENALIQDESIQITVKQKLVNYLQNWEVSPAALLNSNLAAIRWIESYFSGDRVVMQTLWRPVFFAILVTDTINYIQIPQAYKTLYGMYYWQILLGLSSNQDPLHASYTTHMGSALPNQPIYWLPVASLYGASFLLSFSLLVSTCVRKKTKVPLLAELQEAPQGEEIDSKIEDDYDYAYGPTPDQMNRSIKAKRNQLNSLCDLVKVVHDFDRLPYSPEGSGEPSEKNTLRSRLSDTRKLQRDCKSLLLSPIAIVMWWSRGFCGEDLKCCCESFVQVMAYLLMSFISPLAVWNQYRLPIVKGLAYLNYTDAKLLCEAEGKNFSWHNEIGSYGCDACSWPFVDSHSRLTAVGCLDRLFVHQRDPAILRNSIMAIAPRLSEYTVFDWSEQNWFNWSLSDLNETLFHVYKAVNWSVVNLSYAGLNQPKISVDQCRVLSSYFSLMNNVTTVDMSGILIPNQGISMFSEAWSKLPLYSLLLDYIDINETGVLYYWDAIPCLRSFSICGAQLSNETVISKWNPPKQLAELFMQETYLEQAALDSLADRLSGIATLNTVDLSGSGLGNFDINSLANALKNVKVVGLSKCNLNGPALAIMTHIWTNSSVQKLDLSSNDLGSFELPYLSDLIKKQLTHINLAHWLLDDGVINTFISWLPNSSLVSLNLDGVFLPADQKQDFVGNILNFSLTHLVMHDMGLTDEHAITLSKRLLATKSALLSWDLGGNEFTSTGISSLFAAVPQSNLNRLSVAGNDLTGEISNTIWKNMLGENGSLTYLDLSYTNLGDYNLNCLGNSIDKSSRLQGLAIANNEFTGLAFEQFVQGLRYSPPELSGVQPENSVDYNRYVFENTYQDNQLVLLDISGINATDESLKIMCLNYGVFANLTIAGTVFGFDQLNMSDSVDVPGCPAAISLSDYSAEDFIPRRLKAVYFSKNSMEAEYGLSGIIFLAAFFFSLACQAVVQSSSKKPLSVKKQGKNFFHQKKQEDKKQTPEVALLCI